MRLKPKWLRALASTQDAVYVANDAQRIVCWNKGAEKLFGFSESDVLNHLCYQVVGGKVCGKSWCHAGCAVQRSASRGVLLQTLEMQACTRGGQEVWLDVSVFSFERRGRWFTIHVLRDVTREEQRKVALEKVFDTLKAYGVGNGARKDCSNRGFQVYTSGRLLRRSHIEMPVIADVAGKGRLSGFSLGDVVAGPGGDDESDWAAAASYGDPRVASVPGYAVGSLRWECTFAPSGDRYGNGHLLLIRSRYNFGRRKDSNLRNSQHPADAGSPVTQVRQVVRDERRGL